MVIAENRPGDPTFAFFSIAGGTISDLIPPAKAVRAWRVGHRSLQSRYDQGADNVGRSSDGFGGRADAVRHALARHLLHPVPRSSPRRAEFAETSHSPRRTSSAPHVPAPPHSSSASPLWTAEQVESAPVDRGAVLPTRRRPRNLRPQGAGLVGSTADRRSSAQLLSLSPTTPQMGKPVEQGDLRNRVGRSGGAGTWTLRQARRQRATVEQPRDAGARWMAVVQIVARAAVPSPGTTSGSSYRRGACKKITYAFSVTRCASRALLKTLQSGDTRSGDSARRVGGRRRPSRFSGSSARQPSIRGKERSTRSTSRSRP